MELRNKKINFLGDSITEGVGVSCPENIYLNVLAREHGLACARNYGIGGTRIARQNPRTEYSYDRDFCMRVDEMDADADAVVVFGGSNDFGHGNAPIGCFDDRTDETFYGACHVLYNKLIEKYPTAVIVIMTPLHRKDEDVPEIGEKEGVAGLCTYVDIIKEVAAYYSLPVLDLNAVSGIQPKLEIIRETYCPDGLHPNDAGQAIIARKLAAFLKMM